MYKVLIVEDDPMVAMINEQYVCKNKDFTVVKSCRNGQEALDFLKGKDSGAGGNLSGGLGGTGGSGGEKIDLIIMDVFMPYMDGIETFRNMKTMEGNMSKDAPVIMLTANAVGGAKELYLNEGFDDFIAKPIVPEELEKMIKKYLKL